MKLICHNIFSALVFSICTCTWRFVDLNFTVEYVQRLADAVADSFRRHPTSVLTSEDQEINDVVCADVQVCALYRPATQTSRSGLQKVQQAVEIDFHYQDLKWQITSGFLESHRKLSARLRQF